MITANKRTLTAAWCSVNVCSGVFSWPRVESQIWTRLSLAPLARWRPSGAHDRPHTSCVWPCSVPVWWSAIRTSWWWIAPVRLPLQTTTNSHVRIITYSHIQTTTTTNSHIQTTTTTNSHIQTTTTSSHIQTTNSHKQQQISHNLIFTKQCYFKDN